MIILHAMPLPILTGILVPWCVGMSIRAGMEAMLVLPVSRGTVYFAKFSVVAMSLAVVQLLFMGAVLGAGLIHKVDAPIPWEIWRVACLAVGLLACRAAAWSLHGLEQFCRSAGIERCFTIPNMLVANSQTYAPYYPWTRRFWR